MPAAVEDFRKFSYSTARLYASGKYLGKNTYWKIYFLENVLRLIIHTVLAAQYYKDKEWWEDLAGEGAKNSYKRNRKRYLTQDAKLFSIPGKHPLYYIDIKDLNEIIRANRPLFAPVVSDKLLDSLIVKIEEIRIPRNIVAHMNFPTKTDKNRIDLFFDDLNIIVEIVLEKTKKILIP